MKSFKEFYNDKLNEATARTFEELIKEYGSKVRNNKDVRDKAVEIVNKADQELINDFMSDAKKDSFSLSQEEFKNLALAIDFLASNYSRGGKKVKEAFEKLGIEQEEDKKIKDSEIVKAVRSKTNPLIDKIKSSDDEKEDEKPSDEKEADEKPSDEKEADEKETDEKETDEKETDEKGPKINPEKEKNKYEKEPDPKDKKSPAYFAKQATDMLKDKLEELREKARSEGIEDDKRARIEKVINNLEKNINKQINIINKQQDKYSYHSNFSSRLKATTNSKKAFNQINFLLNKADREAFVKGLDTKGQALKKDIKSSAEKVKQKMKDVSQSRAVTKTKDAIKAGVDKAAPVVKRTAEKVAGKIKTEAQDAIIKKYNPEEFEKFVNSKSPDEKKKIYNKALINKRNQEKEADKKRRLAKAKASSGTPKATEKEKAGWIKSTANKVAQNVRSIS